MALRDAGEFLEYAHVHGNWYATSATWLKEQVARGPGRAARNRLAGRGAGAQPDPVVGPHLHPAAVARAAARSGCVRRGQDDEATIARRLEAARDEMRHCAEFDYVIINQDFATAVDDLSAIVRASRLRAAQQCVRHAALIRN